MAGIRALRKVQIGLESTSGTAVPATAMWSGTGTLEDTRELIFPGADVGQYGGSDRTRTAKLGGQIVLEQDASFEQLPYVLSAGVKNIVAGSKDGAGSGYIYAYPLATTAPATIKTYTIEGGDNEQAEEMEYCYVPEFSLSGTGGEPLKLSSTWKGRQVVTTTYTAGIDVPTVETILFSRGTLAIDAVDGTLGATAKSNTLLGMDLKVNTGWKEVWTANGLATPVYAFIKQAAPEITLELTFEHETTSIAEKAAWRAETPRQLRLKFEGSALTEGTSYSKKTLQIDLAGKWSKFDKLDEMDGNDIVKGTFIARFNDTASLFAAFTVVNALTTLP